MASSRLGFGSDWLTTALLYPTSGVGFALSDWLFSGAAESQHAYLAGDNTRTNQHAFLQGYVPQSQPRYILGTQDRFETSLFYATSGVSLAVNNWFFPNSSRTLHAFLNATGIVRESIHAYLSGQTISQTPAYLEGLETLTSSQIAWLTGNVLAQGAIPSWLHGKLPWGSEHPAYLFSQADTDNSTVAYVEGILAAAGVQSAFTEGYATPGDSQVSAWLSGTTASTPFGFTTVIF